jgi:hypothetical protein
MDTKNTNYCIFINKFQKKKCNIICDNCLYCDKHIKYKNIKFFEIINRILKTKNKLFIDAIDDIYLLFKYIQKYKDTNDLKKLLFIKILSYLFNKIVLIELFHSYNIKKNNNKKTIILEIYNIFNTTYKLTVHINKIIIIQKNIRNYLYKLVNKKYNINEISNENDPFTLDKIVDIPKKLRFYFKTGNKIYCFNAIEFDYYIKLNNINPCTREILDENIINKLKLFIKYNKLEIKKNKKEWDTKEQAYTDVVYYMEKVGFYNNVLWFLKLKFNNIINIINIYKDLTSDIDIENNYFNEDLLLILNNNNYVNVFANEIINLFKNGNEHFILCCNFVKALALVSNDFYDNLPDWISNINSTTNMTIFFDTNFEPIEINRVHNNISNIGINLDNIIDNTTIYYLMDLFNR